MAWSGPASATTLGKSSYLCPLSLLGVETRGPKQMDRGWEERGPIPEGFIGQHSSAQVRLGGDIWLEGQGTGGDLRSQGWGDGHSRVGFDTDVVLGNKPLGASELSLVPVLVIFHVQDL